MILLRLASVMGLLSASLPYNSGSRSDAGIADLRCYLNCAEGNRELYATIATIPASGGFDPLRAYADADRLYLLCQQICRLNQF